MKTRLCSWAILCACLFTSTMAWGDEPLEIPQSRKIAPPSGNCWAYTDTATRTTTAYKRNNGKSIRLWAIDGWYRVAGLAAGCEYFVTGYDGVNLLPTHYARNTVMLSFYRNGSLIRQVTLPDLVKDPSKLQKTASHWSWGYYVGVERRTHYRVGTVDRGEIVFDMTTGLPIK